MKQSELGTMKYPCKILEENIQKRDGVLVVHSRLIEYHNGQFTCYARVDYVTKEYKLLTGGQSEAFKFGGKKTSKILMFMVEIAQSIEANLDLNRENTSISDLKNIYKTVVNIKCKYLPIHHNLNSNIVHIELVDRDGKLLARRYLHEDNANTLMIPEEMLPLITEPCTVIVAVVR